MNDERTGPKYWNTIPGCYAVADLAVKNAAGCIMSSAGRMT
jgi:acyl-coenzyme A synthetase/AMP-(fatty) acid ligase